MMTPSHLQAQSAEIRRYFVELLRTLDEGDLLLADLWPVGDDPGREQAPEETLRELRAACERVARRQRLSHLRVEIWKAAARDRVSEEKLIKRLLTLAGPALDLGRCSYFALTRATGDAQCTIQWTRPDIPSTINATMPGSLVKGIVGEKSVAFYEDEPSSKNQGEIAALLARSGVKSILAMPYDDPAAPRGILTFSDCDSVRRWTRAEIDLLAEIGHIISLRAAQLHAEQVALEARERLEQQVRERTGELAAANRRLIEDIAERESAQNALALEKGLMAVTLRSLAEAVVTIDDRECIVLFNAGAEALTGWKAVEAAGKKAKAVLAVYEEDDRTVRSGDFIDRCLATVDRKDECRYLLRARDGTERVVACQCARIRDDAGGSGVVIVLRDITKAYVLEGELLKTKRLESVGVLAAGIAHDFNNLLTGITTYLFMARMSSVANVEACALISEAEKAAMKASSLTRQLLSFSKGTPAIQETASVKQLVQDTIGFSLSGTNVDYTIELPDDLFPVEVDKGQIDQVLTNLFYNAVQAMPGGGTITVVGANVVLEPVEQFQEASPAPHPRTPESLLPLPPGHYVKIAVRDEGVGIPLSQLERIFDPYFTTKKTGTGLGLTTVYSIIKRHAGHIEVESAPGKGSTFTFYLPASSRVAKKKTDDLPGDERSAGRILIMDDDTIVRTVVETLLRKTGYTPVSVANGTEAIDAYVKAREQGQPFSAAIMDLTIPGGMGGKETVKRIREIDPGAKVIAFSGYSNDPIYQNYRGFGFDGVLSKPFSIEDFMRTLQGVLKPPAKNGGIDGVPRHRERP
jgi:PAS domain S-box-containing protein